MKKSLNLICALMAIMAVTGCSYFDSGEPVDVTADHPQAIDLTTGAPIEMQPLAPGQDVAAEGRPFDYAPFGYNDAAEAVRQSSDGRVQIFSLDDEPVADAPFNGSYNDSYNGNGSAIDVSPVTATPLFASSANIKNPYPGVEIYPLDDAMTNFSSPQPSAAPASLMPFPVAENAGHSFGRGGDFVAAATMPGGVPSVIYFAHDSVALSQQDLAQISSLARNYGPGAAQDISVAGHASVQSSVPDPVKRKLINLKVSMDRAFAVARALIESGIPAERVKTHGYGEEVPPAPSDKPVEIAARRVEIYGISTQ